MPKGICYNASRQEDESVVVAREKAPEVATRGFSLVVARWLIP